MSWLFTSHLIWGAPLAIPVGSLLLALMTYLGGYTVFRFGTVMAWIVFCFVSVMMGMFGMGNYFNWHVGLGRTRKSFFICDLITEACFMLSLVEGGILKAFYASYTEEGKSLWGPWLFWIIPVFAVVLAVVREFTGSILMRFGKKAFWVMWALWMLICLLPGNKNGVIGEMIRKVMAGIVGVSVTGWAVMGAALVILLSAVSWLIIRKQAVRG